MSRLHGLLTLVGLTLGVFLALVGLTLSVFLALMRLTFGILLAFVVLLVMRSPMSGMMMVRGTVISFVVPRMNPVTMATMPIRMIPDIMMIVPTIRITIIVNIQASEI